MRGLNAVFLRAGFYDLHLSNVDWAAAKRLYHDMLTDEIPWDIQALLDQVRGFRLAVDLDGVLEWLLGHIARTPPDAKFRWVLF